MRELKFRAWDTEEHSMSDPMTMRQLLTYSPLDEDSADNLMVMQYTGLKDQNGVEIYEGDFIRGDDGALIGVVKYIDDPVSIYAGRYVIAELDDMWVVDDPELEDCNGWATVCGNIHENPELVKT